MNRVTMFAQPICAECGHQATTLWDGACITCYPPPQIPTCRHLDCRRTATAHDRQLCGRHAQHMWDRYLAHVTEVAA